MASKRAFSDEDFSCSVCCDIFKEPVLLSCGHSVCRVCVRQYWHTKGSRECPLCRKRSAKNPPVNLALKNLSQAFAKVRGDPETLCDVHDETLKLYCVDDAQLACVDVLKSALKTVKMKLKNLQDVQVDCQEKIDYMKQQVQHISNQITVEFKKLSQFLASESKAILAMLQRERKEKTQTLKVNIEKINEEMQILSKTVTDVEKEIQSEDITFVKNFEKTLSTTQCTAMDPNLASIDVISVAKYLGNLQYRVWKKMQNITKYTPVVLDPNTAHTQLILSADLTSLRDRDDDEDESNVKVPDTPKRFNRSLCVLGSEGFSLGVHSWDVEVGNNTFWMVGVITESASRTEHSVFPSGAWGIGYDNQQLCARSPSKTYASLPLASIPQVVKVHVDMDAGEVQFSDPLSHTIIYRFTHRFTEKVFPFFLSMCSLSPLRILAPPAVRRTVKQ